MIEVLRCLVAALSTVGLLLVVSSLGIRRHSLDPETRNKGASLVPLMIAIDGGVLNALAHRFPFNAWLWVMTCALAGLDAVWGFYFANTIRMIRSIPTP